MNVAFHFALTQTILARPFILWNLALIICSSCQNNCFRQIEVLVRTPSSEKEVWKEPLRRWWGKESVCGNQWQHANMENLIKRGQNLFDDTHSIAAPILSQLRLIWHKPSEPTDRQDAPDKILLLQPAVGQSCSRGKECHTLECHVTAASA